MDANTAALQRQLLQAKQHIALFAHPDAVAAYQALLLTLCIHLTALLLWPVVHSWGLLAVLAWCAAYSLNLVRTFILAHDCAHGSAFVSPTENDVIGCFVGTLSLMPFRTWRTRHKQHHGVSGIEEEHSGDHGRTVLWSTKDWRRWPLWRKVVLRIARDPFVFFSLGAPIIFVGLGGGLPKVSRLSRRPKAMLAQMPDCATTLAFLALFFAVLRTMLDYHSWLALAGAYLGVCIPLATGMGLSLYHLQHYVNMPYRVPLEEYSRDLASYLGSTYLVVPSWLKWATLGIEYHHIHHLSTAVPCYKLQACHESAPPGTWEGINTITPAKALRAMFNVMWDENTRKYVSFPEYEALFALVGW